MFFLAPLLDITGLLYSVSFPYDIKTAGFLANHCDAFTVYLGLLLFIIVIQVPEILRYLLHPVYLIHGERASVVAMSASDTVFGSLVQRQIVFSGHIVPDPGKIIELVDHSDIKSGRTGLAMITVDTFSVCFRWSKGTDDAVVEVVICLVIIPQQCIHFLYTLCPGKHCQNTRLIQRISNALIGSQCFSERGSMCIQKLPAGEGLHNRDPNTQLLTSFIDFCSFIHTAARIFAMMIIIRRVYGKHQHIDQIFVKDLLYHRRRVGGCSDVANNSLALQIQKMIKDSVFPIFVPIGVSS